MLHPERTWAIVDVASGEELADNLVDHVFTRCTGFRHDGYLVLNDSASEDGPKEYAIVRESDLLHVGSMILVASPDTAKWLILTLLASGFPATGYGTIPAERIQSVAAHGRCPLCA